MVQKRRFGKGNNKFLKRGDLFGRVFDRTRFIEFIFVIDRICGRLFRLGIYGPGRNSVYRGFLTCLCTNRNYRQATT